MTFQRAYVNILWMVLFLLQGSAVNPLYAASNKAEEIKAEYALELCHDNILQVEFLCNPEWDYRVVNDALLIIIASKPAVTVTLAKIDSKIHFLSQLSRDVLSKKNLYKDGFRAEVVKINGKDALVVRAFAKGAEERRLLDHFFIKEGELYGVLFSVNPKKEWDRYKFLIKTISESIIFYSDDANNAS